MNQNRSLLEEILIGTIRGTIRNETNIPIENKVVNAFLDTLPDIISFETTTLKNKIKNNLNKKKIPIVEYTDKSKNVWDN